MKGPANEKMAVALNLDALIAPSTVYAITLAVDGLDEELVGAQMVATNKSTNACN